MICILYMIVVEGKDGVYRIYSVYISLLLGGYNYDVYTEYDNSER